MFEKNFNLPKLPDVKPVEKEKINHEIESFPELDQKLKKLNAEILAVTPQAKNLETQELRKEFQALRYKIFSEQEGFEPPNESRLEIDSFDNYSAYIVIKRENKIIAGCRLILAQGNQQPMPVSVEWPELEFAPNSAEVSRFCLDSEIPPAERIEFIRFLYDGATETAKQLNIEHLYSNIRKNFLLLFKKFIKDIGEKITILNPEGKQYKSVGILVPVEFDFKSERKNILPEKKAA